MIAAIAGLLAFTIQLLAVASPARSSGSGTTRRVAVAPDLRAWYAAQRGEFGRAVSLQVETCREDGRRHEQWRALAMYQEAAGEAEAAAESWATAARLLGRDRPGLRDDSFWLAEYQERSGDLDAAGRTAENQARGLKAQAEAGAADPTLWYHLGWARARLGDAAGAQEAWAHAVDDAVLVGADASPGSLYNRACYLAVAGRPTEALDVLEAAIAEGWNDGFWARRDRDFESVRDNPRFDEVLSRIRHGRRGEVFTP